MSTAAERFSLDQPVDGHPGDSNFERLIFNYDREGAAVTAHDGRARARGGFRLSQGALARLRADFDSARASEAETTAAIARTYRTTGEVSHAAHGRRCPRGGGAAGRPGGADGGAGDGASGEVPDAVEAACGVRPALPPRMAELMTKPERVTRVANDLAAIEDVIGREAVR